MNTTKSFEYTKTFKAKIITSRPHFVQKVCVYKAKVDDAYNSRFHSIITIFIPKLRLDYKKPCVMCHIQNGNGSVLIRAESPEKLAETFTALANTLLSEKWFDLWQEINHLSEGIIDNNQLLLDEEFVDTQDLEKQIDVD